MYLQADVTSNDFKRRFATHYPEKPIHVYINLRCESSRVTSA